MIRIGVIRLLCGIIFASRLALVVAQEQPPSQPKITSVTLEGTNIIVKVSAPAGLRKVTLETRSHLESSTWAPKALQRFDSATTDSQELTFVLRRSANLEVLRVRADATDALPAAFFKGTNQFAGPQAAAPTSPPTPGSVNDTSGGGPSGVFPGPTERTVAESDIWKVYGDTLYFFNNLRGLQVINIADPAAPILKGTFSIAASGEQMYVLPSGHAVLLTRSWCSEPGSKILIVDGSGTAPTLAATIPISGYLAESRMVGSALYLVSQDYRERALETGGTMWEPVMVLTSIDLANPAAPIKRNTQTLAGYPNTIYATDRYLLTVAWNNYYIGSDLQLVDISSPTGEFTVLSTIHATGAVADKFKLNINGDTLTIISHAWTDDTTRWTTMLENFSLANPRAPVKVGSLRLAQGEQLHATRFDGNRAYIVTFFRIDPLWIVDLSDAAHPKIAGELQVPGWSTYLQPLGDRVVALGIDDTNSWRVAVSLFDVSDVAAPKLLSKVALGENSSWSEASYDEKALTVLPDDGLILVPFTGYTTNGQASHVQLIDLAQNSLTARGQISDHIYPRRATLHRDHIVSISGREFISYNAANRDQPVLKARIDLAWPVNKVFLSGDYLLELDTGSYNGGYYYYSAYSQQSPAPVIRVARADHPETILSATTLPNDFPITGADLRNDKLYVVQSRASYYPGIVLWDLASAGSPQQDVPTADFIFSIWDVSQLPAVSKSSELHVPMTDDLGSLTPLWPKPNLLVWSGGLQFNWWWGGPIDFVGVPLPVSATQMATTANVGIAAPIAPIGRFWGSSGGRLAAFDVSDSSAPILKNVIEIATNSWNFSKPFVTEGLVYLSHQTTEQILIPIDPVPTDPTDPSKTNTTIIPQGWGDGTNIIRFITRTFLDVVDYTDAANPVIRKPVNIPGSLEGASHQGGVIYTTGPHFDADGNSNGNEFFDASAYDGVAAFLIDSLALTNWPHPIVVQSPDIFIGSPTNLTRWQLADDGMFTMLSTTETKAPVYTFHFFGNLAALNTGDNILLYDATDRAALKLSGQAPVSCNTNNDLDNSDGSVQRGLYIPLSDYGVQYIAVTPPPAQ